MSERKVLNKYYPPDFDPNNIPKLRRPANRQFSIRIMAPFNMRCGTCGEYIYKGKKFNSRQEKVEDEDYLGLMIFRFYIKCPRCVSEISFKTDPQNCDYELEAGATRNFEALRTAEILAEREMKEKEEEEKNNPMKVLENRTKSSRQEMEMIETLEELRELNSRHAKVDHDSIIRKHKAYEEQLRKLQDEQDEEFIRSVFGTGGGGESVKRIHDDDEDDKSSSSAPKTPRLGAKPSDILTQISASDESTKSTTTSVKPSGKPPSQTSRPPASWQRSVGVLSTKKSLSGLVRKKPAASTTQKSTPSITSKSTPSTTSASTSSTTLESMPSTTSESTPEPSKPTPAPSTTPKSSSSPESTKPTELKTSDIAQLNKNAAGVFSGDNSSHKTATSELTSVTSSSAGENLSNSTREGRQLNICDQSSVRNTEQATDGKNTGDKPAVDKPTGLGLLGAYSDSSTDNDD